jgi:hypothetical protein
MLGLVMHDDVELPRAVPLVEPRRLSAAERALVEWFVDGPVSSPALRAQVAAASVVATCSCGCPSVHLEVPAPFPAARLDRDDPDVRTGGDASFRADATSSDGRALEVILHVLAGRLVELEIWAGSFGGDPRTELPQICTLHR